MIDEENRTVLLVEDESIIALSEKAELERLGYRVILAGSAEEAVAAVERGLVPDLILMDINLGRGMDGAEGARLILEHRHVPIVFLSSYTDKETIRRVESVSSYGYVVKNTGITVLHASIRT